MSEQPESHIASCSDRPIVQPSEINPILSTSRNQPTASSRSSSADLITPSPYNQALFERQSLKAKRSPNPIKRLSQSNKQQTKPQNPSKRKRKAVDSDSSSGSEDDVL
ncbi:hypothetical protein PR048_015964 [Dryococelus australis]|uniref:Uncharacterized protein n=1 Tax=Dryococelus australis TaxID=614101 RepID=A0ABQ9HIM7_9NEOP|nr:hypothetical protein PR048_015964 [Dryococelus australis]